MSLLSKYQTKRYIITIINGSHFYNTVYVMHTLGPWADRIGQNGFKKIVFSIIVSSVMLLHLDVKQTPDSFESEAFLTHICFTFFVLLYILIKYDSRSENYFGWKSSLLLLDFMMPREQHFWLNLNYTRKWSFNFFLCSTFLLRVGC